MQSFSAYFIFAVLAGGALVWAATSLDAKRVEEFYGFAQTEETEINSNYPIEVQEILVEPGAAVKAGQLLMRVKRATPKEELADQNFRIDELQAEERIAVQRFDTKLSDLETDYQRDRQQLLARQAELQREQRYRQQLLDALDSGAAPSYTPIADQLQQLERELQQLGAAYEAQRNALQRERQLASRPYASASQRLAAERDFDASQQEIIFDITAPSAGVIGSINAKLAEHKSSFSPLLIFYEPNPTQVKAYIHEDRILRAAVGDSVMVNSISSEKAGCMGMITGMGSRIVEIPSRLRRMADLKTYGREVIVSIPATNKFLQNEKVRLEFITSLND